MLASTIMRSSLRYVLPSYKIMSMSYNGMFSSLASMLLNSVIILHSCWAFYACAAVKFLTLRVIMLLTSNYRAKSAVPASISSCSMPM